MAIQFGKAFPNANITCFDNLKRRGSELNLEILRSHGIGFIHGDIRNSEDFQTLDGPYDLFIEASAEPSVHAGIDGSPEYLIHTNLLGTINCLEYVRQKGNGFFIFLSTSRVYSILDINNIPLRESREAGRFNLDQTKTLPSGLSNKGINEEFNVGNYRSLYGTTKLSSEYFIQEYAQNHGLKATINRCGVLCGEGQWGKTDQGVFTLWVARHHFQQSLSYTGFGGNGFQVRDLLHPEDLFELLKLQLDRGNSGPPLLFNVGGGAENSVSLHQFTMLAREATGNEISIGQVETTSPMDIPYYISDNSRVESEYDWKVKIVPAEIVKRIAIWIQENESKLKPFFSQKS